jgi:hypothetical protein
LCIVHASQYLKRSAKNDGPSTKSIDEASDKT